MKTTDIAWLAGLLEGEAHFALERGSHPRISLAMVDLDVCIRAAEVLGAEAVRLKKNPHGVQQQYSVRLGGRRALEWLMTLYPLMGERRKSRFREIIKHWKATPTSPHSVPKVSLTSRGASIVWQRAPAPLPLLG